MTPTRTGWTMLTVVVLALWAGASLADEDEDDDDDGRTPVAPARTDPRWKQYEAECGSCHLAFPPRLLPPGSWKAVLGSLNDHFGQNAELDAKTRATLEPWLVANAGRGDGAPLRITSLPWWRREHRGVQSTVWTRKSVQSPANCAACHTRANEGAFGEHEVRIPRDAPAAR